MIRERNIELRKKLRVLEVVLKKESKYKIK